MDTHAFKTDNPILTELGLGSFTVDTLREWVEKNNHANLNYIGFDADTECGSAAQNPRQGRVPFPLEPDCVNEAMTYIVGTNNLVDGVDQLYIKNYRPTGRTSEKFTYQWIADRSLELSQGFFVSQEAGLYWEKDEDLWNYRVEANAGGIDVDIDAAFAFDSIMQAKTNSYNIAHTAASTNKTALPYPKPWNDNVVAELIAINEWITSEENKENYAALHQARSILIRDIITSYDGCLKWKSNFGLRIPSMTGSKVCNIEVDWSLHFYNEGDIEEAVVALKTPVINSVPVNAVGQQITTRNTDERKAIPTGDDSEKKTGELDTTYNEFTGRYESGTTQMWGILTTPLAAAILPDQMVPDGTTDLVKKFLDKETGYGLTHGEAMPLHQKTGNPHNWGPEYKYFDSCDLDADQKIEVDTVSVHNMFAIAFEKGETVLLQRIQGQWFPIRAEGAEARTVEGSVGRWQFMYLMSNVDNYFRNSKGDKISFLDYETSISNYYSYVKNNPGGGGTPPVDDIENITHNTAGYVQCSSFDSMGPQVGGWLAGNVLANTQLGMNADGTNKTLLEIHPLDTAPFFGCVFPDGYVGGEKFVNYLNGTNVPKMMVTGVCDIDTGVSPQENSNDYIKNIDAGTAIFAAGNSIEYYQNDMFSLGADGAALQNLPADIATNALPDSSTGGPMPIMRQFEDYLDLPGDNHPFATSNFNPSAIGDFLDPNNRSTTLINSIDNTATFDLPPIDPTRIQFRPLKLEVYASFEVTTNGYLNGYQYGDVGANAWRGVDQIFITPLINPDDQNDNSGNKFWTAPMSRKVIYRAVGTSPAGVVVDSAHVASRVGAAAARYDAGPLSLAYNVTIRDINKLPATNTTFPQAVGTIHGTWSRHVQAPIPWKLEPARPAGALGIIGAQCEVFANTNINFYALLMYGIDDVGRPDSGGGEQNEALGIASVTSGFNNFASGGGGAGAWHSSFGVPAPSYDAPNNTVLCARIYHHHPRELTVYDPRFFAIHHFSEGANEEIETKYYNGTTVITKEEYEDAELEDGTQLSYKYKDQAWKKRIKKYSKTDFSEPTYRHNPGADTFGVTAIAGALVYKDDPDSPSWRDPDDWIVKDARGSLLPAKVSMSAIGITVTSDPDNQIKIEKGGAGYNLSNRFATRGGAGSGVLLVPATGSNGAITGFSIANSPNSATINQGRSFLPSDFFTEAEITNNKDAYASAKIRIVPTGSVGGAGLQAYIRFGNVYEEEVIVAKPKSAISQQFVTVTPQLGTMNLGGNGPKKSMVYGDWTQSVKIANPSSDSKYDVFLHYHNDISHVMLQKDGYAAMNVREQMIDLKILPE